MSIISAFISDEAGKLILDEKGEFLAKPLDRTVLAAKVHQLLASRWKMKIRLYVFAGTERLGSSNLSVQRNSGAEYEVKSRPG